jgi:hypothetical protein
MRKYQKSLTDAHLITDNTVNRKSKQQTRGDSAEEKIDSTKPQSISQKKSQNFALA